MDAIGAKVVQLDGIKLIIRSSALRSELRRRTTSCRVLGYPLNSPKTKFRTNWLYSKKSKYSLKILAIFPSEGAAQPVCCRW